MRPGAGDGAEGKAERARDVEAGEGAGAGLGGGPLGGEGQGRREDHRRQGPQGHEDRIVRPVADSPEQGESGGVAGAAEAEQDERTVAAHQAVGAQLQEGERQQEGGERPAAGRRIGAVLLEQPERKDDDEEAHREALHGVDRPGEKEARARGESAADRRQARPRVTAGGLLERQRHCCQEEEERPRQSERCTRPPVLRDEAADRRAEPDAQDQRGAGETGEARPAPVVGAVEEERHRGRPAGDRGPALQEAQREEQWNPVDPEVGEVEQAARRETADDEWPAAAEAVGECPPERREEQVGDHLDGEEERRVGDRTAELVDHEFLETGDDQRQIQHGDEEAGAG